MGDEVVVRDFQRWRFSTMGTDAITLRANGHELMVELFNAKIYRGFGVSARDHATLAHTTIMERGYTAGWVERVGLTICSQAASQTDALPVTLMMKHRNHMRMTCFSNLTTYLIASNTGK